MTSTPNYRQLTRHDVFMAVGYLCFLLVVGTFAILEAASHYLADAAVSSGSIKQAEMAIEFQPGNPDAYKSLGEIFSRTGNYAAAAAAFDQAVSLRENDFRHWVTLGDARYRSNDVTGAESAYNRALSLAPNYAQPSYHFGKMLLETGRTEQAFVQLRNAGERDHELYNEILLIARTVYHDDAVSIQNAMQPSSTTTKNYFAYYAVTNSLMTPEVEEFLASPERTDKERTWYIRRLIKLGNFQAAFKIWAGSRGEVLLVSDGGFERIAESDPSGLGWQFDQKVSNTSVTRIDANTRSGAYAINIHFSGQVEPSRSVISQILMLKPQHRYQLRFSYRTEKLFPPEALVVRITDAVSGAILGSAGPLNETGGKWIDKSVDFVTESNALAMISFQSDKCPYGPCPIFGDVYLDEFAIDEY